MVWSLHCNRIGARGFNNLSARPYIQKFKRLSTREICLNTGESQDLIVVIMKYLPTLFKGPYMGVHSWYYDYLLMQFTQKKLA